MKTAVLIVEKAYGKKLLFKKSQTKAASSVAQTMLARLFLFLFFLFLFCFFLFLFCFMLISLLFQAVRCPTKSGVSFLLSSPLFSTLLTSPPFPSPPPFFFSGTQDDLLGEWRKQQQEKRAALMLQNFVRRFLERKKQQQMKEGKGGGEEEGGGEGREEVLGRLEGRLEGCWYGEERFLEKTVVGKNVLFEVEGEGEGGGGEGDWWEGGRVRVRAVSEVKLVEFLFSPFYEDRGLIEDILYTFEVFFLLNLLFPIVSHLCISFSGRYADNGVF